VPHADEMQELLVRVKEMEHKLEGTEESRQMYLQMIARLEGESTFFNRDLGKVKAAADAKEQDEAELQLMLTDATHARDDAQQQCVEIQHADQAQAGQGACQAREAAREAARAVRGARG
jgi:chromosome segregation ATPase